MGFSVRSLRPALLLDRIRCILAACVCLCIGACGGGGGGAASTPAAVAVSISAAPSAAVVGQAVTLTWSAASAASCDASGAWSGQVAPSGTQSIVALTVGTSTYTITCNGVSSTASVVVSADSGINNVASVSVDNGPAAANGSINVPFVNVTVCRPGTTVCQTIDHVLVDTGSYGLRLLAPLDAALALPAIQTPLGAAAGECAQFVSGFAWGAVRQADVRIAGETASSISIHVVNDATPAFATIPADCSSTGSNLGSVAALGANGILGIGLFKQDCGASCVNAAIGATYYSCTATSCRASSMPLARQVVNPAAAFATDNNGLVLIFPGVPSGGVTSLSGSLIFGIGTHANNSILSEAVYLANASGNFATTYKGRALTSSFIDSGSNGLFFSDRSVPTCTQAVGFYCPPTPLTLNAINSSVDGSTSNTVNFTIENADILSPAITAASIGGSNGSRSRISGNNAFDWGLPFFFGRRVFIAFDASASPNGNGPYWAY